ncbi:hypothetical protein CM1200mP19_1620 [bacterium]|nr:MAG: hypothetical protein CM1200mP19_1620 [bacterium]
MRCDHRNQVEEMFDVALAEFGSVDVLVKRGVAIVNR